MTADYAALQNQVCLPFIIAESVYINNEGIDMGIKGTHLAFHVIKSTSINPYNLHNKSENFSQCFTILSFLYCQTFIPKDYNLKKVLFFLFV